MFVAGAGPFRAIDPVTTETADRVSRQGMTTVVHDRLGRGDSPADGVLDLERELAALAAVIAVADRGTGRGAVLWALVRLHDRARAAARVGLPVTGLVLWEAPLGDDAAATKEWIDEFERRLDAEDYVGATEQYMKDMPPEWLEGMRRSPTSRSSRGARAASAPTASPSSARRPRSRTGRSRAWASRCSRRTGRRRSRDAALRTEDRGRGAARRGPRGRRRVPLLEPVAMADVLARFVRDAAGR